MAMHFVRRILLLGDEPRVCALVRDSLAVAGGFYLREEHNSRIAMQIAHRFRPDGIFFGCSNDANGWHDVIQQIKTDAMLRTAPLFVLTSDGDNIAFDGSLEGYEFSATPMNIAELARSIGELSEL
jgi:PleD family two-component response regulator